MFELCRGGQEAIFYANMEAKGLAYGIIPVLTWVLIICSTVR